MNEVSQRTIKLVNSFFKETDRIEAIRLLLTFDTAFKCDYERIHYAAIKFSGGDLKELYDAIKLANADWRDLLILIGFDDTKAHMRWVKSILCD